ncbi:MAG TPA: hypothetical protein DC047_05035 [Blastocatellia bacterium]|nr:hypothetical protein [Blastocatellia bacterium]
MKHPQARRIATTVNAHSAIRYLGLLTILFCLAVAGSWEMRVSHSQTAKGEIEGRASPTFRRICLGGGNAGKLCKQNTECPGSTCRDRNVFNITVAVMYNAPAGDLTSIGNMITAMSAVLLDVTDGQAEIGTATIHNNAMTGAQADLMIEPTTNDTWWNANTGLFRTGGQMHVSINYITAANTGSLLAHEFSHLVFDPRDEYESRAVGCGAASPNEHCPVTAANDGTCLMDSNGSEFCWGQANTGNLTDLSGGNHDPSDVTEQSRCRSNRSCWDQLVWSWPTVFMKPAGAPDPGSNGEVPDPVNFVVTNNNVRVVLVLDESGSMSLESPTRMARLKVAAGDFIATAQNGAELGLRSFASDAEPASGRANVAVAALVNNRAPWTNAVSGLTPSTRTNIGAGLQKAKDMIMSAGGVTANTYIVLMTDGLNNEPAPDANAAADLQAKINDLMANNIPVFVTCTGGDLGLQSQCAEIAAGTGGFNSDSADAARLPQNFVDFQERITAHQGVKSFEGMLSKINSNGPPTFFVDEGSESASFSLLWDNSAANARGAVIDPGGTSHQLQSVPQGLYVRVANPKPGDWRMQVDPSGADSRFSAKAYVLNRVNDLVVSTRWPTRRPGEEMYVFAMPRSKGGAITEPGSKLTARVSRPDGSTDTLDLFDNGRDAPEHGDDIPGDGIFTGVYKNTNLKGAYGFQVNGEFEKWHQGSDAHQQNYKIESPKFLREVRVSAGIGDPGDHPKEPEDTKGGQNPPRDWCRLCCWLAGIFFILFLIALFLLWRCWQKKRG